MSWGSGLPLTQTDFKDHKNKRPYPCGVVTAARGREITEEEAEREKRDGGGCPEEEEEEEM